MLSALWAEPACQSTSSPYLGPDIMTVFKIKVSHSPTEYQLPAIERCPVLRTNRPIMQQGEKYHRIHLKHLQT